MDAVTETPLLHRFRGARGQSLLACEPLQVEDFSLQAEIFTSPPKWHLAHTSWFFETFVLTPFMAGYEVFDEHYAVLFNSYYNGVGEQFPRARRGLLSRPSVEAVLEYREHVDQHMTRLLGDNGHPRWADISARTRLGIEHEQQHQELFYTDLKYSLSLNPLQPAYTQPQTTAAGSPEAVPGEAAWTEFAGGLVSVGRDAPGPGGEEFAFDNENPRHPVYLAPYALSRRLVTNAEFQAFIDDGGYRRPELWLSDGWTVVQDRQWRAPLYWLAQDGLPAEYTLYGPLPRQPNAPVTHLSGYEADAFARWAGARLPTEFEWEHAAATHDVPLPDFDPCRLHPAPATGGETLQQLYGACWQWTGSAYRPYPGFRAPDGAIGEYNGKFMANQWVLRGGSCVSQTGHVRASYRNFFYPADRWQFSGIRLAMDL